MKSISLTETEINHIKETYTQELKKLQKRSDEIEEILKKLKDLGVSDSQPEIKKSKKKLEKVVEVPAKRGRKSAKAEETPPQETAQPKAKRGRPAKQQAEKSDVTAAEKLVATAPKTPGKRGRKPKDAGLVEAKEGKTKKVAKPAKAARIKKTAKKASGTSKRGRKKVAKASENQTENPELTGI